MKSNMQVVTLVAQFPTIDTIAKHFSVAFNREVQALLHRPEFAHVFQYRRGGHHVGIYALHLPGQISTRYYPENHKGLTE